MDIDGVLCPFGGSETPPGYAPIPGEPWTVYSYSHSRWLKELQTKFDLVWASMWEHTANEIMSPLHDLDPLPVIPIDALPDPYGDTFKLPSIRKFIGKAPFAWVDDEIHEDALVWAAKRSETIPTLLLPIKCEKGLCREDVDLLLAFAAAIC